MALLAGVAVACLAAAPRARPQAASPRPAPATRPSTGPAASPSPSGRLTPQQKVENLLNYLETDYAKKTAAPYWVTRAMGVISLARSPRPSSTTKLLEILEKDKQDVVRLLAWQALLGRAPDLDAKTHARWVAATWPLAHRDAFKGGLRVPLVQLMATAPPTAPGKKQFEKIFSETSAWESRDIPVLDALGDCLAAWKSGPAAESLVKLLADPNHCVRAEYVLQRAGCKAPTARSTLKPEVFDPGAKSRIHPSSTELWQKSQSEHMAWFRKEAANWKEVRKMEGEPWKKLQPYYIAAPTPIDSIDPEDKSWYQDLELGRADLDSFEAVFVVDATGSMGDVLAWLKRDVAKVVNAFTLVCKESPAIGLTFYRDNGDRGWSSPVKHVPLSYKLEALEPDLRSVTADGGGDIPEAVLEGLTDAIKGNKWSKRTTPNSKAVVLIGDAPPHADTEAQCLELVKKAKETGVKVHAVKVRTEQGRANDLSAFDAIAAVSGSTAIEVDFPRLMQHRYLDQAGRDIPVWTIDRPETQTIVALPPSGEQPGEKILAYVLSDAINPEYRNKVEPLARTLLAYCEPKPEPEKRKAFPSNTPPLVPADYNPQGK